MFIKNIIFFLKIVCMRYFIGKTDTILQIFKDFEFSDFVNFLRGTVDKHWSWPHKYMLTLTLRDLQKRIFVFKNIFWYLYNYIINSSNSYYCKIFSLELEILKHYWLFCISYQTRTNQQIRILNSDVENISLKMQRY